MAQQNFALGTVGWDKDPNYYDIASAGTDKCLVKVTLVWGRNPTAALVGANAQGQKVLATLPGPIFHLPDLGDLVQLGIPEGMERMPIAATIQGWHKPTPTGFSATNAMWPIEDGKTAQLGDANARFVAHSDETAQSFSAIGQFMLAFNNPTFLTALTSYISGIQAIADPSNSFTPPMLASITALGSALTTAKSTLDSKAPTLPTTKIKLT